MTREEAISIMKDIRTEMEDARDKIAVVAVDVAIKSMEQIDVESVIDQLWEDIESTCTTYSVDGDTITTDVGYADDGIIFFIKHLKERLKAAAENDTVEKWVVSEVRCPYCLEYFDTDEFSIGSLNKCPNCEKPLKLHS